MFLLASRWDESFNFHSQYEVVHFQDVFVFFPPTLSLMCQRMVRQIIIRAVILGAGRVSPAVGVVCLIHASYSFIFSMCPFATWYEYLF